MAGIFRRISLPEGNILLGDELPVGELLHGKLLLW